MIVKDADPFTMRALADQERIAELEAERDKWHGDAVSQMYKIIEIAEERNKCKRRVAELEAVLRSDGANRYWEGRWRDAVAEIEKLAADDLRILNLVIDQREALRFCVNELKAEIQRLSTPD